MLADYVNQWYQAVMTRNVASLQQERAIISDASEKHSPSPSLAPKHSAQCAQRWVIYTSHAQLEFPFNMYTRDKHAAFVKLLAVISLNR